MEPTKYELEGGTGDHLRGVGVCRNGWKYHLGQSLIEGCRCAIFYPAPRAVTPTPSKETL